MTQRQAEELADTIALLIREVYADEEVEADLKPHTLRIARCVERIESEAYRRGYDARQVELVENLRKAAERFPSV